MKKFLRSSLSLLLSSLIALLAPGFGAYTTAAETLIAPAEGSRDATVSIAVPGIENGPTTAAIDRNLSLAAPVNFSVPIPSLGNIPHSGPLISDLIRQDSRRRFAGSEPSASNHAQTAYEGLARELPKFGEIPLQTARASTETDFLNRIGQFKSGGSETFIAPNVRPSKTLSPLLRNSLYRTVRKLRIPAATLPVLTGATVFTQTADAVSAIAIILFSLILHEMGHAKSADMLGDPTSRLQNRLSFTPKGLLTHIDFKMTILIPVITYFLAGVVFGGAKPVPVDPGRFRQPIRDMAIVAVAGPLTNYALAFFAGFIHAMVLGMGITGTIPTLLVLFMQVNLLLGTFNLIPISPLDGHHILRYVVSRTLGRQAAAQLDNLWSKLGFLGGLLLVFVAARFLLPFIWAVVNALTHLFLLGRS